MHPNTYGIFKNLHTTFKAKVFPDMMIIDENVGEQWLRAGGQERNALIQTS